MATDPHDSARRRFLAALGCCVLPLPAIASSAGSRSEQLVLFACAADRDGPFCQAVDGPAVSTPTRGHGLLPIPGRNELIVVARRPGDWLWRIDWQRGEILTQVEAHPERRFFGHAILSANGRTLFATENDLESGRGVVGVYDLATLQRLGEFSTHGIGPHELLWIEPDRILAVANGGILTLPESGRMKLNLDRMEPSLVLLEMPRARVLATHTLDDKTLSLRHLARSADGTLGVALQAESPDGRSVDDAPLLALLRSDRLTLAEALPGLGGYGASVAACGDRFLVTALKGDTVGVWRSDGRFERGIGLPLPAGIAADGERVFVSNELGLIVAMDPASGEVQPRIRRAGVRWDNHLTVAVRTAR